MKAAFVAISQSIVAFFWYVGIVAAMSYGVIWYMLNCYS